MRAIGADRVLWVDPSGGTYELRAARSEPAVEPRELSPSRH